METKEHLLILLFIMYIIADTARKEDKLHDKIIKIGIMVVCTYYIIITV